ncbi:MAG: MoaD/ThiS family protein [Candidatus Bathyarchaeia archaeon]
MIVSVKFVGSFRGISGKDKLTLKFGRPVSLTALVKKTVEQLPKLKSSLIDPESGEPRRSMLVLVNGKEISVLNGLETRVNDEDEVIFVPVVHGG